MTREPKYCQNFFDANAFNRNDPQDGPRVDRLLALAEQRKFSLIMPHTVQTEIKDPRTPTNVQRDAMAQIFTLPTEKTAHEAEQARKILAVMRGKATSPGKHEADAAHIADLDKHGGGYFITHDERLLKKQVELANVAPGVFTVTLERFLEIYDEYEAKRASMHGQSV
jgi:hypothetical protein